MPKQIIRLQTDSELTGIGETPRGTSVDEVVQGARLLLGRDPERLVLQNIFATPTDGSETLIPTGQGPAYDTFEMAIFDLVGQACRECSGPS